MFDRRFCGEQVEKFLSAILKETQENLKVLPAAPPAVKPGTWVSSPKTREESQQLAGCYHAVARRLDIVFTDAGNWKADLTYDGVHFSGEGHRAFAEEIRTALYSLFSKEQ